MSPAEEAVRAKGTKPETACLSGNQKRCLGWSGDIRPGPGPAAPPSVGPAPQTNGKMQILRGSQAYLLSNSGDGALQALS